MLAYTLLLYITTQGNARCVVAGADLRLDGEHLVLGGYL